MTIINNSLAYSADTLVYNNECELLWPDYIPDPRYLTLTQTPGGTITADKLSGYDGDIVTLSNTPSAEYNFSGYSCTGAELSGDKFAFNGSDVTAQANFVSTILASGNYQITNDKHYVTGHYPNSYNSNGYFWPSQLINANVSGYVHVTIPWMPEGYRELYCLVPTNFFDGGDRYNTYTALKVQTVINSWTPIEFTGKTTATSFYIAQMDGGGGGSYMDSGNWWIK